MQGNTTSKLLIEVAKNIEVFGEQHTHDLLYKERTKNQCAKDLNFVISMVCENFSITPEQVINDKGRGNNKRVMAMKFISYYAYQFFSNNGVSAHLIAARLKRHHTLVTKHHLSLTNTRKDKSNQYDQKIFKDFDLKVKNYLGTQKKSKR